MTAALAPARARRLPAAGGAIGSILHGVSISEMYTQSKSGNQLQVEFETGSRTANGIGVAKDDLCNICKLIF